MMNDELVEIDADSMAVTRRFMLKPGAEHGMSGPDPMAMADHTMAAPKPADVGCSPTWAQPSADGRTLWVACNKANDLVEIDAGIVTDHGPLRAGVQSASGLVCQPAPIRLSARDWSSSERFISAVLASLDIDRAVLVGHSLGGAIAIAEAGNDPDRVAGLALVAAPGKVPDEQARQIVGAMEADYEKTSAGFWDQLSAGARPPVAEQLLRERGDLDAATGLAIIKATFAFDPRPALRRYPGPKLAIVTPRGTAPHDLQNAVDDLPHRVVEGTSHFLQMDDPTAFNAILDEFLATLD